MHLRDARVDLDGNLIASGRITYPPDDSGSFPIVAHERLRIVRGPRNSVLTISPTLAERDHNTGFYARADVGPEVFIPHSIGVAIQQVLRSDLTGPIAMTVQAEAGTLLSSSDRETAKRQSLSNWRAEISHREGMVDVRLSADLLRTQPNLPMENFWANRDQAARIEISLSVDLITRAACFGTYSDRIPEEPRRGDASLRQSSLGDPILEHAMVGIFCSAYATDLRGNWIRLHSSPSPPSLSLESLSSRARTASGLVSYNNHFHWPRVCFSGIDLDLINEMMGRKPTLTLVFSDGESGVLDQHRSFYEDEPTHLQQSIVEAKHSFELTEAGLRYCYKALVTNLDRQIYAPGWIEDEMVLSWETLILRYPQFLRHRKQIAAASDRSGRQS